MKVGQPGIRGGAFQFVAALHDLPAEFAHVQARLARLREHAVLFLLDVVAHVFTEHLDARG